MNKWAMIVVLSSLCVGCEDDKASSYLETVQVAQLGMTGISIDAGASALLEQEQRVSWAVSASFKSGDDKDYSDLVHWQSSNSDVVSVDGSGALQSHAVGEAKITVRYGRFSASDTVTVSSAQLQSISFDPASPSLDECKNINMAASGHYDDGTVRELTESLSWASSNTAVATVGEQNTAGITLLSHLAGTATLTATRGEISGETVITALDTLTAIALNNTSLTINAGDSSSLSATGSYSDSSSFDITDNSSWALVDSADASYLSVGNSRSNKGVITGVAAGSAAVRANCGGLDNATDATITVDADKTLSDVSFDVSDSPWLLQTTDTEKSLILYANYSDNSSTDVSADATWTVIEGDTDLITVGTATDEEGDIVFGADIGDITEDTSVVIKATYESKTALIQVTVEAP